MAHRTTSRRTTSRQSGGCGCGLAGTSWKDDARHVSFRVDLEGPNEQVRLYRGWDYKGRQLAQLHRFGQLVTTFAASESQVEKIRARRGVIHITEESIKTVAQGWTARYGR